MRTSSFASCSMVKFSSLLHNESFFRFLFKDPCKWSILCSICLWFTSRHFIILLWWSITFWGFSCFFFQDNKVVLCSIGTWYILWNQKECKCTLEVMTGICCSVEWSYVECFDTSMKVISFEIPLLSSFNIKYSTVELIFSFVCVCSGSVNLQRVIKRFIARRV